MRPELHPKTVSDQLVITLNKFKTVGTMCPSSNSLEWCWVEVFTPRYFYSDYSDFSQNRFKYHYTNIMKGLLTHFVDTVTIYVLVLDFIFTADDVWKFLFATPRWIEGTEECVTGFVCDCYGNAVVRHNPPLLFNVAKDPSERIPLDITTQDHKHLLQEINNFIAEHNTELYNEPTANQFCVATSDASAMVTTML